MSNTFISFFFFYLLRNLNFNFTRIIMGEGKIIVLLYPFYLSIAFKDKETADSNHPNSASGF